MAQQQGDDRLTDSDRSTIESAITSRDGASGPDDWFGSGPVADLQTSFDTEMDDVSDRVESRNTDLESVALAWKAVTDSDGRMVSHDEMQNRTDMGYHDARKAAVVLSDVGDIHEAYDEDWNLWWVWCDQFLKDKTEERRISLHRYFIMVDELREFQDQVLSWYVRRNRRQSQEYTLTSLKERYVHQLKEQYFPEKPVEEEWSRHIAARYLRTAQDVIVRSMDLTY